jgi:MoxR-like ATPase
MRFTVMETSDEVLAKKRPLVIITSNNEKELPDAFLRRCVFYFIDFPDVNLMRQIVDVHHPRLETQLLDQVLVKFYWLREQSELRKKPSTSELIDWISVLLRSGMTADDIEHHIPFLGALLKNERDTEALDQFQERGGNYPSDWSQLGPRYNN